MYSATCASERVGRRVAAVDVHYVAQALEGEEGDAYGQGYLRQGYAEDTRGEPGVFEPEEQRQVQSDGGGEQGPPSPHTRQQQARAPVEQYGKEQQRQGAQSGTGVEKRLAASSTKFRPPRKRPGTMKYRAMTTVRKKKRKLTLLKTNASPPPCIK